jgi:hypothetical protein
MEVGELLLMDLLVFLEQLRRHFVVDLDEMEHLELILELLLVLELDFLVVLDLVVCLVHFELVGFLVFEV